MWGSYPLLTSRHSLQLILCTISTFKRFSAGKKFRRAKQTIMKTKKTPAPQIEHRSWPSRPCWCNGNPGQMECPADPLGSFIKASFKSSCWYSLWFKVTKLLAFYSFKTPLSHTGALGFQAPQHLEQTSSPSPLINLCSRYLKMHLLIGVL